MSVSRYGLPVGPSATHPQYRKQFQVEHYTVQLPATIDIRKYLGSGLILGPKTATKSVDFSRAVIEKEPQRALSVSSIGHKRVLKIVPRQERGDFARTSP